MPGTVPKQASQRMWPPRCERWEHRAMSLRSNLFSMSWRSSAGEDPVDWRLRHLRDERARDVIRAVAERANCKPAKQPGIGHGIGFACYKNSGTYCAVVAEVEGNRTSTRGRAGQIRPVTA
jgi:hypothetical protein